MKPLIKTEKLSKWYLGGKVKALSGLSLQVAGGEVYGFLGANGAGKTTTIRTLLNFIQPSGGSASILGKDIVKDSVKVKRHVGYLSGEVALYPKMTGREFLDYMRALQPPKNPKRSAELAGQFEAQLDQPLAEISKGNRQKIGLIQAFMHEPQVLILDEPTSGLDPLMQEAFFELVKSSKSRGAALFISSHNLAEVQRMCDRIGFIRGGKLVAEQSIAELNSIAAQSFDITFRGSAPLKDLAKLPGSQIKKLTEERVTIHIQGDLTPLLQLLASAKVARLDKTEVNLEEEFLQFYRSKPT